MEIIRYEWKVYWKKKGELEDERVLKLSGMRKLKVDAKLDMQNCINELTENGNKVEYYEIVSHAHNKN